MTNPTDLLLKTSLDWTKKHLDRNVTNIIMTYVRPAPCYEASSGPQTTVCPNCFEVFIVGHAFFFVGVNFGKCPCKNCRLCGVCSLIASWHVLYGRCAWHQYEYDQCKKLTRITL